MGLMDKARKLAEHASEVRAEFVQRVGTGQLAGSPTYSPSAPASPQPAAGAAARQEAITAEATAADGARIRADCSRVGVPCPADLLDTEVLASILGEAVAGPRLWWEQWEGPHATWDTVASPGVHVDVKCGAPDPDEGERVDAAWADAYFTLGDRPSWYELAEPLEIRGVDWAKVERAVSGLSVAFRRGSLIVELELADQSGTDCRQITVAVTQAVADSLQSAS